MVCWVLDQFADGDHVEFDRMRAQVVWQTNRVADYRQVKSAVGWPVSLDEFRLIPCCVNSISNQAFALLVIRA